MDIGNKIKQNVSNEHSTLKYDKTRSSVIYSYDAKMYQYRQINDHDIAIDKIGHVLL